MTLLTDGSEVDFEQDGCRLILKGLPKTGPDGIANIAVFKIEFVESPEFIAHVYYPQLNGGRAF